MMERDFLGLSSKDSFALVKEEVMDGSRDSAFTRASGMQWSFSNKVSALPQLMSFKTLHEERPKNIVFDPLASSGFIPVSTPDAFDAKKNFNLSRQGAHHGLKAYPLQDMRMFSLSNQTISSVGMGNPFFKTHVGTAGQNLSVTTMKQQPLGGIPHSILPALESVAGANDPRKSFKSSGSPAQLTIFYAGSVAVYDDISPEKAQAIMFLAGNGASIASNTTKPEAQIRGSILKPGVGDHIQGNQSHSTSPCSGLSSPPSVTSHVGPQSGSGNGSSSPNELKATKPVGALTTPTNKLDPPKIATSLGSTTAGLIPSAVPQARKASLVRFLEKRKERVVSAAPYNNNNNNTNLQTKLQI